MPEMLGVLALIGILSVGALIGYNYAINRYKVNAILNDVRQLSIVASSYDLMHPEVWSQTGESLGFKSELGLLYMASHLEEGHFEIAVHNVQGKICRLVLVEQIPFVLNVKANPDQGSVCLDTEDNQVVFYFSDGVVQCDMGNPCLGTCHVCQNGICTDEDEKCPQDKKCNNGFCSNCPKGLFSHPDGACKKCDDSSQLPYNMTMEECHSCGMGVRYFRPNDMGLCLSCFRSTSSHRLDVKNECDRCPNRVFLADDRGSNERGSCIICDSSVENVPARLEHCNLCRNRYFDVAKKVCNCCPSGQTKNEAGTGCKEVDNLK